MFGLFRSPTIADAVLGELKHAKGHWRGTIEVEGGRVPLAIAGSRKAPDERSLDAARAIPARWAALRPRIEAALFEHYAPYAEALDDGAESEVDMRSPADVWRFATPKFAAVAPMGGPLITEVGLAVDWDEEHLPGARFDEGGFVELCGSTVAP